VNVHVRFLHLLTRHEDDTPWDEATERRLSLEMALHNSRTCGLFRWPGLREGRRSQADLRCDVDVRVDALADLSEVFKVSVTVRNTTAMPLREAARAAVLRHSLVSAHVLLEGPQASFVSLIDPPARLAAAASACHSLGLYPGLVGDPD